MDKQRKLKQENKRHIFQGLWTLITNSYLIGFMRGKIYQGSIKNICVPGLNCYSCPGAVGSCPIGSLQAVVGSHQYKMSFYITGFMIFIGSLMGRFVCGYLCPFGLFQDLIYKIPGLKKIKVKKVRVDKAVRWLKYIIFIIFVILLPMFFVDIIGQGSPYFCKLICPAGTLQGGIPLVLLNKRLRSTVGLLYAWKLSILIIISLISIVIYRPFCKYLCPLGAVYSLFNPISVFKYHLDTEKCINCNACKNICEMGCDPVKDSNSLECIRCGKCKSICPTNAITYTYFNK